MKILNENGNEFINNWVACKKTSYVIQAKRDDSIKEVYNCLERSNVSVRENEVILKGLLGEMWAISEKKFLDRYTDTKGNSLKYLVEKKNFDWVDVATKASNTIYYSCLVPIGKECGIYGMATDKENEAVYHNAKGEGFRTLFLINSSDSISTHGDGDRLLCADKDGKPDISDIWVVDGEIFLKTYKLL